MPLQGATKAIEPTEKFDLSGEVNDLNLKLVEMSKLIFPGSEVLLKVVHPRTIVTLKRNARFMPKETFDQLTRNIKGDKVLSSVPFCHTLEDGRLEVLSGNHRVKASIEAGLDRILVMVVPYQMKPGRKIAVQLSHNALSGQDDIPLLKELWDEIDELNEKLYSGLDSVAVQELAKVNFSGFGAQVIRTEQVTLFFIPEEVAEFDKLLDAFDKLATSQTIYLAPLSHDKLFELIVAKKKEGNIKNTSVALMALIDSLVKANDGTQNTSAEQPAK